MRQIGRQFLDAEHDGHRVAEQDVAAAMRGADRADQHRTLFDADAERQRLKTFGRIFRQHFGDFDFLHLAGRLQGARGGIAVPGVPDGDQAVALELVYAAAAVLDDARGPGEEEMQHRCGFLGRARFAEGREIAQVGAKQGHLRAAGVDVRTRQAIGDLAGDLVRQITGQIAEDAAALGAHPAVFEQQQRSRGQRTVQRREQPSEPDALALQQLDVQRQHGCRQEYAGHRQAYGRPAVAARGEQEQRGRGGDAQQAEQQSGGSGRPGDRAVEQAGEDAGLEFDSLRDAGVWRRHDIAAHAESGEADQRPGVVEPGRIEFAVEYVDGGNRAERGRVAGVGNPQIAFAVEWNFEIGIGDQPQILVRAQQAVAVDQGRGPVFGLNRGQPGGQRQRRIAFAFHADRGGRLAYGAVARNERRYMPFRNTRENAVRRQISVGLRQAGAALQTGQRMRKTAGLYGLPGLQHRQLRQHRAAACRERFRQHPVARARFGIDDIVQLQLCAGFVYRRDQPRQGLPRPGPGTDFGQAGFIDGHKGDALFLGGIGVQRPAQRAEAFFQRQHGRTQTRVKRDREHGRQRQHGQSRPGGRQAQQGCHGVAESHLGHR